MGKKGERDKKNEYRRRKWEERDSQTDIREKNTKIKSDTEKDNEGRDTYSSEGVLIWRQKNGLAS